ncbi:MAG: hypothetical protein K8R89_02880 [Anaerolineae bacterium]|nr:hypothetical protein [Anaerolineae bacterium]
MARSERPRGKCIFCGREMTRGGLSRHWEACSEREKAIAVAEQGDERRQRLYQLQVQDVWGGDYWLHLEMNGTATLDDLDYYLRGIWLECCGHLSMFTYGGWSDEIPMSARVDTLFEPGVKLTHLYDFGSTSETLIKVRKVRTGRPLTAHPIFLLARNNPPDLRCMECGAPATHLCLECLYEDDKSGLLCDRHVEKHPHDDYGEPLPVGNSPRMGMCAYCGPSEPPY